MTTKQVFEQVVHDHHAMIHRIAASYEATSTTVEDLVQDIYIAIWQSLPAFRGESSIRTFVARIATNRAITHVARASRRPLTVELNEHLPASGADPERSDHEQLAQALPTVVCTGAQVCRWTSKPAGI